MSILRKLEKMSEKLVEGVFKLNLKSQVQPAEIAKFIGKIMSEDKIVGTEQVMVPDRYEIFVGDKDYQHLKPVEAEVFAEIKRYLTKYMSGRNYSTVKPLQLTLKLEKGIKAGEFDVTSAFSEVSSVEGKTFMDQKEETMVFVPVTYGKDKVAEVQPAGELVVLAGKEPGMVYRVKGRVSTIGRRSTSDVYLEDPKCSREHAKIVVEGDKFVLIDVGSSNGTRVNKRVIIEKELKPGDKLQIGDHLLEFRVVKT